MRDMEAIVLKDIRGLAQLIVEEEEKAKERFLERKAKHHEDQYSVDTQKLSEGKSRLLDLDTLIPSIVTVSGALGHSTVSTTSIIYCHVLEEAQTKVSDAVSMVLNFQGQKKEPKGE